jgi:hypothetical protein
VPLLEFAVNTRAACMWRPLGRVPQNERAVGPHAGEACRPALADTCPQRSSVARVGASSIIKGAGTFETELRKFPRIHCATIS